MMNAQEVSARYVHDQYSQRSGSAFEVYSRPRRVGWFSILVNLSALSCWVFIAAAFWIGSGR